MQTELWIWRGIRMELPPTWEMLQFQRDLPHGRCAFADQQQMRLELSWRTAAEPPHMLKLRQDLATRLAASGAQATTHLQYGGWLGLTGAAHGQEFTNCSRHFPVAQLLLELFIWWPGGRDAAMESALLDGCAPSADPPRWRALSLDIHTDLPLWSCTAQPGLTRLEFAASEDSPERLIVERCGMARHWLAAPLEQWNRAQAPSTLRAPTHGSTQTASGEAHWLAGTPRRAPLRRLGRRFTSLLKRRKHHKERYVTAALAVPERNEVRRVEQWSVSEPMAIEALVANCLLGETPPPPPPKFKHPPGVPAATGTEGVTLPPPVSWQKLLAARPVRNMAVETSSPPGGATGLVIKVANVRPGWYRPPLSWFIPWRSHKQLALDPLGTAIWQRCDGDTTAEQFIATFCAEHQVTFHEARVCISHYLRMLMERGLVVMVQPDPASR